VKSIHLEARPKSKVTIVLVKRAGDLKKFNRFLAELVSIAMVTRTLNHLYFLQNNSALSPFHQKLHLCCPQMALVLTFYHVKSSTETREKRI
jgi:hypothetical protein